MRELSPWEHLVVTFKSFEKLLCKKIPIFVNPLLCKYHCLLAILEKWKETLLVRVTHLVHWFIDCDALGEGKGNALGAFDCFSHELIIVKLNSYCLNLLHTYLIHSYISNKKRTNAYNLWENTLFWSTLRLISTYCLASFKVIYFLW